MNHEMVNVYENDVLYSIIKKKRDTFGKDADSHKWLNRILWLVSALVSVSVAVLINLASTHDASMEVYLFCAQVLAILLPVVTSYSIMRSPESLWIMETYMRNRLNDLLTRFEMYYEKDPEFERTTLQDEYFAIMQEANNEWLAIKKKQKLEQ